MRALVVFAVALALTACGSEKTDPNAKAAGGEVLPGTISDAMIDLDRSTATAPLAPATGGTGEKKKDESAGAPAAEGTAAAQSAAEEGAGEATAETAKAGAAPSQSPKAFE